MTSELETAWAEALATKLDDTAPSYARMLRATAKLIPAQEEAITALTADIERLTAQLAEARQAERVQRGEFICTKCYLRQDGDFTPGDF